MRMNEITTTNKLLMIIVIPILFYILDVLSFIFIPFMFAIFIGMLYSPLMRWLKKKNFPKLMAVAIVIATTTVAILIIYKLVVLSGHEINMGKRELYDKLDIKIATIFAPYLEILGIQENPDTTSTIKNILQSKQISEIIFGEFGNTIAMLQKTAVMVLMTVFFLVLLLAGSLNFKMIIQELFSRGSTQTIKTFVSVEKNITRFLKVKFLMSLCTGLSFGLICYFFNINFPLFWGLLAFVLNFVQLVGSVVVTVLLSLLVFIEIEHPGTLVLVIFLLIAVQLIFGSVIEPILMGKSFSINIVVVLVMLMFWSYLWGVPGLILAIPMTVLMKTILGEFRSTRWIVRLMS
ncbi:MAG: AI-2E family transporter [Cyclobacteriaceae bacterium]|nr:AI-2E family transporter [Cyclobacteriaceae bacterium]